MSRPRGKRTRAGGTNSSSSTADELHTPRKGVGCVDVKEVTKRFSRLGDGNLGLHSSMTPATPQSRPRKGVVRGRALFQSQVPKSRSLPSWRAVEILALVTFILLHTGGNAWPGRRGDSDFWDSAAKFVQSFARVDHLRTGGACRAKVVKKLSREFKSVTDAEKHFKDLVENECVSNSSLGTCVEDSVSAVYSTTTPQSKETSTAAPVHSAVASNYTPFTISADSLQDIADNCLKLLEPLDCNKKLTVLSMLFITISEISLPSDFLHLSMNAMQNLRTAGRSNTLYLLAKGLGTMQGNGLDSLLPVKRMPMGLIDYAVNFFTVSSVQQIICPPDYRQFLQTNYILFGTKWSKLFSGPMWSYAPIMQQDASVDSNSAHPTDALINVPSLSERTLRRDIAKSDISTGPEIQKHMLKQAFQSDPTTTWWIKGDGVDVTRGLGVSTRDEWSGDVDLNNGTLNSLYQEYKDRLKLAAEIGLGDHRTQQLITFDLNKVIEKLNEDLIFIHKDLQKISTTYAEKQRSKTVHEKEMFSLAWDIQELNGLNDKGRSLKTELSSALDIVGLPQGMQRDCNLSYKLCSLRAKLTEFIKGIYKFKRIPATHAFVFMISSALRNKKPYALPIQCIPYSSLKEVDMRRMINTIVQEMISVGMKVAGFVSNGEFNYLRGRGYTRPLSVLQIRTDARNKYSRIRQNLLMEMLSPRVLPDGSVVAECYNAAVTTSLLVEIQDWMHNGATMSDVIDRLRPRTVPAGYTPHSWHIGKTETLTDKLRSILAQLEYQYLIATWEKEGVEFKTYLYVPEKHPITQDVFYEREDEAHVFKRIANHTRVGGNNELNLECYVEALNDESTNLTYPALTGQRKQSVADAERMFNPDVAEFMRSKGYAYEAKYIQTIWNWRRACDQRGLTELQRCRFNYQFLEMILDELIPWHNKIYDMSLLEVNRPIYNVLGFSRETLLAVITNIEGREWSRRLTTGIPEHPRASTSDDVECFFSIMRDTIGANFTTKQLKFGFRKVTLEFEKILDPDLPFYYHTSSHTRFSEGPLPTFNVASTKPKRKGKRVPRRELQQAFAARHATLPVHGSLTVRAQFHNQPIHLPPPPSGPLVVF